VIYIFLNLCLQSNTTPQMITSQSPEWDKSKMYVFSNVAEQDVEYLVFKLIHKVFVPFSFVLNMYLKFFVCLYV
jgi:hypothetical protein